MTDKKKDVLRLVCGVDPGKTTGVVLIRLNLTQDEWALVYRSDLPHVEDGAGLYGLFTFLQAKLTTSRPGQLPMMAVAMEQLMAYKIAAQEKAEAQACVRMAAYCARVPLHSYAPTSIRATVIGSGKAKQGDVSKVLREYTGMQRSPRGEAFTKHQQDALAAALCFAVRESYLSESKPEQGQPRLTKEA